MLETRLWLGWKLQWRWQEELAAVEEGVRQPSFVGEEVAAEASGFAGDSSYRHWASLGHAAGCLIWMWIAWQLFLEEVVVHRD